MVDTMIVSKVSDSEDLKLIKYLFDRLKLNYKIINPNNKTDVYNYEFVNKLLEKDNTSDVSLEDIFKMF